MPASDHKRRLTAFVVAMAVLIATPLAVVATDAFTDVPTSSVHHDNITWLKDAGVTSGCNPPDNDEYCPSDNVTRAQMATFMRNLATNQVVDAATAQTSGDAEMLDGNDSSAYQTVVAAANCGLNASATEISCGPNADGTIPDQTTVEVLEVDISAPAPGVITLSGLASANVADSPLVVWVTLNDDCAPFTDLVGILANAANRLVFQAETLDGAGSTVVEVGSGDHTVRMCGVYPGDDSNGQFLQANLSATWTAEGTVEVLETATDAGATLDIPDLNN